ncbi:MAG: hypothetical protein LWW86_04610 [Micrococcales bacterium]|nr:hypothetical protein [Micrococcales bacterium]
MAKTQTTIITGAAAVAAAGAMAFTAASLANADTQQQQGATGYSVPGYGNQQGGPNGQQGDGQRGGMAGHSHTQVTGDELAKVTAAVKAKDSAVTVTSVQKDPDGSYDVMGTKAGAQVMVEASKDLKTIEVRTGGPGGGGRGGHGGMQQGTEVTGANLDKIKAAVKAKDSTLTVERAMKLTDGTYRAMAAKSDGTRAGVTLDKDFKITNVRTGMDKGGAGHTHTAVTGAELTKVKDAVKAKDSAVTVTSVQKDADGSYDVHGTKAGAQVMVEVSKDLKTIEVRTGGPGGPGGGHGMRGGDQQGEQGQSGQQGQQGGTSSTNPSDANNGTAANASYVVI